MFQEFETKIFGRRAILREVKGGINIELIGKNESKEVLDGIAGNIADPFDGTYETPDHPDRSHIRLIRIRDEDCDLHLDLSGFLSVLRRSISY